MWKLSGATRLTRSVLAFSMAGVCALGLFLLVPVAAQPAGDPVIYLDQGWSQADRELFYQTPQGSSIASYDIFMNMEVAGSQELFRSDANSARLGLIPQAANPRTNPDGFPVGITKNVVTEGRWKGETVGPNCAVCHTAQLMYKGKQIRIDGGHTNLFDIQAYMQALDQAFQAALSDTAKFDRMAARAGATSADAKSDLRKRFASRSRADALLQHRRRSLSIPLGARPRRLPHVDRAIGCSPSNPTFPRTCRCLRRPSRFPLSGMPGRQPGRNGAGGRRIRSLAIMAKPWVCTYPWTCNPRRRKKASSIRPPRFSISRRSRTRCGGWRLPSGRKKYSARSIVRKPQQGKALFANNCVSCHNI